MTRITGLANVEGGNNVGGANAGIFNGPAEPWARLQYWLQPSGGDKPQIARGRYNIGFANTGNNLGFANTGDNNIGFANIGSNNIRIRLTGSGRSFGELGRPQYRLVQLRVTVMHQLFNSGSGNFRDELPGAGGWGIETRAPEAGIRRGQHQHGLVRSETSTRVANPGSYNTGSVNAGSVSTGGHRKVQHRLLQHRRLQHRHG